MKTIKLSLGDLRQLEAKGCLDFIAVEEST
jgi:hypothetical protein